MSLRFLEFDHSEDTAGQATFDALATVDPTQWPALQREVATLLAWAHATFPDGPASLDDGAAWDCQLDGRLETEQPLALDWPGAGETLDARPQGRAIQRHTVQLTLSGTPAFADALRARLGLDAADAPVGHRPRGRG